MSEDDKAREAAKAEPQAIEPPASEPAPAAEPPKARPRPVPNANGHAGAESSAKAE
jgi:hypothetical protein